MNIRAVSTVLGLAVALGAGAAIAQQPTTVGRLTGLEGDVLVSQDDAMVAAANNQRVAVGTRVVTLAGAKVVIDYDVGCNVALKENERFTVRLGECAALVSQVVDLGPAPGAIGGGVGAATTAAAGDLTGIGIATAGSVGAVIYFFQESNSAN